MRTQESIFSLGDLQQVVLVAAGVLSILDLFLPPLQNRSIGLRIGWVQEAGVATTERGPAGLQRSGCIYTNLQSVLLSITLLWVHFLSISLHRRKHARAQTTA